MTFLAQQLHRLDGAGYGAYKSIRGVHRLNEHLEISIDRVQSDPYAPPSLLQAYVPVAATQMTADLRDTITATAVADHLTRRVQHAIRKYVPHKDKSTGGLSIDAPGQQVLERTSVTFCHDPIPQVIVRMEAALPAQGRRIRGKAASTLLTKLLPTVIDHALLALDHEALAHSIALLRDQTRLRELLVENDLVAFIANGAVLPRASGDSDLPAEHAVPFSSPDSLERSFQLPSGRQVTGMALPRGVTLIIGGGYHGKSTVLRALERGVYNHTDGDGREFATTVDDAVALRAEDGRSVVGVDISPFIGELPGGVDTTCFSTTNASGSTSQAASLIESLEAGATTLLIDEDTSATNFMVRDERMRRLVPSDKEPITPLQDRVRALWEDLGVSTILVAGGSGAFLDVADRVLLLDHYQVSDITEQALQLAEPIAQQDPFPAPRNRAVKSLRGPSRSKPQRGGKQSWQAKGLATLKYPGGIVDLSAVPQLVDASQTNSIAAILRLFEDRTPEYQEVGEIIAEIFAQIDREGLDSISSFRGHPGRLARPRPQEVFAAINRIRSLAIRQ